MLTCAELVELITDYLEDALAPAERARFERHIADCDGCGHYLDQVRRLAAISGQLREAQLEGDVRQRLLDAFRTWRQGGARSG